MKWIILFAGFLPFLIGCGLQPIRNKGIEYLGQMSMGVTAYRDYYQVKTAGVNGPDVTVILERHCAPYNGPIKCTPTRAWDAGAAGMAEAFLANGFQGLTQMGGLIGLGALIRPDRTNIGNSVSPANVTTAPPAGPAMPVAPMPTPMPMGGGRD